jgi:hypothetical protein
MRRNDYSTRKKPIFWFESLLRCCFIAIVALFLVQEGRKAPANVSFGKILGACYLSDYAANNSDGTKPGPLEREARDEGESESDSKDETDPLNHTVTHRITNVFHSGKLLFFQLRLASESRASISLIILHHCWKSFPH